MPEILIVTSVGDNHLAERLVWGCVWWCLPWGLKAGSREVMAAFPFVPRTMEKPARRGKTSHRCPNYDRCWFPLGQGKWEGREGGAGQKKMERPHGKITKVQIPRVMTTYLDHAFRSRVWTFSKGILWSLEDLQSQPAGKAHGWALLKSHTYPVTRKTNHKKNLFRLTWVFQTYLTTYNVCPENTLGKPRFWLW